MSAPTRTSPAPIVAAAPPGAAAAAATAAKPPAPPDTGEPPVPLRPAHGAAASRRVLAIGEERRTRRIRRALEGSGDSRVSIALAAGEAARCMEKGEFDTVILTVPLRGARIEQALSQLRSLAPGRQPTYLALVPPDFASERVRDLYARGARLVLAWPDDVSHLDEWLNLAAGPSDALRAGDTERIEQRLERAVRERLRLRLRRFAKGLAVEARSGVARLSGRVGSLWAKRAVERHAAASPGVRDVDAHRLEVEASSRTDASIGQEIRALLDGTSSIDASTLGVSVHAGRVVLIGALLNVERDHVLELISMVPGVRSLVDASSPSALRKWRDRRRARRLAHKLRTRVSGADLRVAVVGSTAVLRGVGSTREIHDATAALDQLVQSSRSLRTALHRASWTRPAAG